MAGGLGAENVEKLAGVFTEFFFPLGGAEVAEALPILGAKENEIEALLVAMEGGVGVEEALEDLVVGRVIDVRDEMEALEPVVEGRGERLGCEGGRDFEREAGAGRGVAHGERRFCTPMSVRSWRSLLAGKSWRHC